MNDVANKQLLERAHQKHEQELSDYEQRMNNLNALICLHLRERNIHKQELDLLRLQVEEGSEMNKQYMQVRAGSFDLFIDMFN